MRHFKPNYVSASRGNRSELHHALDYLDKRVGQLEKKTGTRSFSSQLNTPLAAPPPQAVIAFSAAPGKFIVRITNPEYAGRGNERKTPILHRLSFSPSPDFPSGGDSFPISTQTYYSIPIEDLGGTAGTAFTGHLRVDSSIDGQNFNLPQQSQRLSA